MRVGLRLGSQKLPFATGLKGGVFATVEEIAAAEKINTSYVSRSCGSLCSRLDGRQSAEITLAVLMKPFRVEWWEQQTAIGFCPGASRIDGAENVR